MSSVVDEDDDQRQDQEHYVALDLDGVEQARIGLLPVDEPNIARRARRSSRRLALGIRCGIGERRLRGWRPCLGSRRNGFAESSGA